MLYDEKLAADPPSRVTWEIEPHDGGICKLTVIHDNFKVRPRLSGSGRRLELCAQWT